MYTIYDNKTYLGQAAKAVGEVCILQVCGCVWVDAGTRKNTKSALPLCYLTTSRQDSQSIYTVCRPCATILLQRAVSWPF